MFPRVSQTFTLLLISATLVCGSPAPAPIDPTLAQIIAENKNTGCTAPGGCAANSSNSTESLATSAAVSLTTSPGSSSALAAALAIAGGLSITALL
ncbi:uncharacterized protein LAESUDRAFT_225976 [Laetiporus sulphureus 93-53]|uniref:Uncharacterized protein n=1 Tax=Laetiporus sulphureus 93-53 TaxID=1314785 RepID=A0A165DPR4_9APHY|nr:uncharacterized protein LAESUDRAFT_225976 [Laetiporus sulphureus 93-53]KZT05356.1 hypothetical protein LAESUDRAFT_225976 [Laetiporus sulphureus 93-53]